MRALVTGGTGFIGQHLVRFLRAQGDDVVVLDIASQPNLGGKQLIADVRNVSLLARQKAHVIYHLAGQTSVQGSMRSPVYDADANIAGMIAVLQAAEQTDAKVVFASTGGAMFDLGRNAREEDTPNPISPYGVSKLCAEKYAEMWVRERGVECVVLRLANVYGPGDRRGVIPIFLRSMLADEEPRISADGRQARDFIHVDDVVKALHVAAACPSGCFHVGTDIPTSINQLFGLCAEETRFTGGAIYEDERPGEPRYAVLDSTFFRMTAGWRSEINLAQGIRGMVSGECEDICTGPLGCIGVCGSP